MNAPVENSEKAKGTPPVIKGITLGESGWQETLALWRVKGESKADLSGFIVKDGKPIHVVGFINNNTENGTKFITLSESSGNDLNRIATGNAINKHKDGSQPFFDTIAFNFKDGTEGGIFGRLTKEADAELQQQLGFEAPRIPRPARAEKTITRPNGDTVIVGGVSLVKGEGDLEHEAAGEIDRPRG